MMNLLMIGRSRGPASDLVDRPGTLTLPRWKASDWKADEVVRAKGLLASGRLLLGMRWSLKRRGGNSISVADVGSADAVLFAWVPRRKLDMVQCFAFEAQSITQRHRSQPLKPFWTN